MDGRELIQGVGGEGRSHFGCFSYFFFFHLHACVRTTTRRVPNPHRRIQWQLDKGHAGQNVGATVYGERSLLPRMMKKLPWLALNKSTWLCSLMIYDNLLLSLSSGQSKLQGVEKKKGYWNVSLGIFILNTWKEVKEIKALGCNRDRNRNKFLKKIYWKRLFVYISLRIVSF